MSQILVYEPQPWFLPELQRLYQSEKISVAAGNERQRHAAGSSTAVSTGDETAKCVIVDLRQRPERCLGFVEESHRRYRDARLILIADERLAPLEWVLRELGVAHVEINPVRGVDLKILIDRLLKSGIKSPPF